MRRTKGNVRTRLQALAREMGKTAYGPFAYWQPEVAARIGEWSECVALAAAAFPSAERLDLEPKVKPMNETCIRCGRTSDDFIHDVNTPHGGTGTAEMHPFVDEGRKNLLQWTAREVALHGKVGQKRHAPDPQYADWNRVIDVAKAAVESMFEPIPADRLTDFDRYWKDEYAKRAGHGGVAPQDREKP